jgi:hypothetical protein
VLRRRQDVAAASDQRLVEADDAGRRSSGVHGSPELGPEAGHEIRATEGRAPASLLWRVQEAYAAEVELERARWKAITAFVEMLSEDERRAPGYRDFRSR